MTTRQVQQSENLLPRWIVGEDPYTDEEDIRYLFHQRCPRFIARWSFGPPPVQPRSDSAVFKEEDEGDAIHIFDFIWQDSEPDSITFKSLMSDATAALDRWLELNSELLETDRDYLSL